MASVAVSGRTERLTGGMLVPVESSPRGDVASFAGAAFARAGLGTGGFFAAIVARGAMDATAGKGASSVASLGTVAGRGAVVGLTALAGGGTSAVRAAGVGAVAATGRGTTVAGLGTEAGARTKEERGSPTGFDVSKLRATKAPRASPVVARSIVELHGRSRSSLDERTRNDRREGGSMAHPGRCLETSSM